MHVSVPELWTRHGLDAQRGKCLSTDSRPKVPGTHRNHERNLGKFGVHCLLPCSFNEENPVSVRRVRVHKSKHTSTPCYLGVMDANFHNLLARGSRLSLLPDYLIKRDRRSRAHSACCQIA
jgi:hypothetical protein